MSLYSIAHILRDRFGGLWNIIEWVNGVIFYMRYGKKLNAFSFTTTPDGYEAVPLRDVQTETLVAFFNRQLEEAFTFFTPHGFDAKSIKKLQKNRAFLAYVLMDKGAGQIAGYCFNRSFFHGVGFRGRMVDINFRGRGLGTG